MFHKVLRVTPVDGMKLSVVFMDGEKRVCDVAPLLDKWQSFKALQNNGLFESVRVDAGGYGVVWNDELDLSCDELWHNGQTVEDFSGYRVASPAK